MQKSYSPARVGIAWVIFAAFAGSAGAVTIKGTITDAALRTPLSGMVAAAYSPAGLLAAAATSDLLGQYVLPVPAGRYRVLAYDLRGAYATEFGVDADSFDTSPTVDVTTTSITGVNFAMQKGGVVTGSVTSGGAPLSLITVAAYNAASGTRRGFTLTAGDGTYSLVLPPGNYKLAAYDDTGFYGVSSLTTVSVASGQHAMDINFQLPLAAHLTGSVIDAETKLVLPGMLVIAYSPDGAVAAATGSTDAAGNFALTASPGTYKLVATDPTRVYATGYVADSNSFSADPAISVAAAASVGSTIPLHRGGAVAGKVATDSGNALANISIAAYNDDGSQRIVTMSDAAGAFALILPPGAFRMGAFDSTLTFATQFYPQRALFADATAVMVSVAQSTPSINFALSRGAHFNGTVVDQNSGAAIGGISVAAYDDAGNQVSLGTTDSSGNFALVVPNGRYKLAAFDNQLRYVTGYGGGARNYETALVYEADGTATKRVDFALSRGVRVSGTVIDSGAVFSPVSGVQIAALDLSGDRIATATTKDGIFDVVLAPGTYKLLAVDPQGRFFAMFYRQAWTLQTASAITVGGNVAPLIQMSLVRVSRRHSVRH